jgi:hypothetical protein
MMSEAEPRSEQATAMRKNRSFRRPRRPPGEPFLFIIVDHDNRRFTVEAPMTDAQAWIREVIAGRRSGRQITCAAFAGSTR